jgi:hypothetical protein
MTFPSHVRGTSIARGMSLAGYKGALASGGLTFDDVDLVEVPDHLRNIGGSGRDLAPRRQPASTGCGRSRRWSTAMSTRSMSRAPPRWTAPAKPGWSVAVDLDALPDPRFRVNNGTPRPITVHQICSTIISTCWSASSR